MMATGQDCYLRETQRKNNSEKIEDTDTIEHTCGNTTHSQR